MTNKKILAPLFVAMSMLLIACSSDTINAKPTWENDTIINVDGLKNNTFSELYDAIKKLGDTNSSVLNTVLYNIAKKQIGSFEELIKFKDSSANVNALKEFINAHPIYASDATGYWYNSTDDKYVQEELKDEVALKNSRQKIEQQYNEIVNLIFKKLYEEIKADSYKVTTIKLFSEQKFVNRLAKELYISTYVAEDLPSMEADQKRVFTPKVNDDDDPISWKSYVNYNNTDKGFIRVMDDDNEFTPQYKEYVTRKLLPDIYHTLLIETYVKEQRYSNLGRTHARKVNMITVPINDYERVTYKLLTNYVKENITGEKGEPTTYNSDLYELNSLLIGINDGTGSDDAYTALKNAGFTPFTTKDGTEVKLNFHVDQYGEHADTGNVMFVFKGTKLGEVYKKLETAADITKDNSAPDGSNITYRKKYKPTSDEESAYNELTNNGAYDLATGLELKARDAVLTDMTTNGWFLKGEGLTDLDEDYRNKLFNSRVSSLIDNDPDTHELKDPVAYFYDASENGGAYLLGPGDFNENPSDTVVIIGKSNYFIVQVKEAVSSSKLSVADEVNSYLKLKVDQTAGKDGLGESNEKMNEIIHNIVSKASEGDTYKSNADQYYLTISNIVFYDQDIYDYFKSQFPELFN